jgi:hypothetical protein
MGCGCNNNFNGKKMKRNSKKIKSNFSTFRGDSVFSRNVNKKEVFANLSGFNRTTHDRNFGAKINKNDLMGF